MTPTFTVVAACAFAPAIFWLWIFYRKDKWEPEPLRLVLLVFGLGALIVYPVALLERALTSWDALLTAPAGLQGAVTGTIVAPVVEEIAKFLIVFWMMYRHPEFDEPVDGIVYAAAAALGFAAVENVFYVWGQMPRADGTGSVGAAASVWVVRALLSVPGHVIFSSMWGYALGIAKFMPAGRRAATILLGVLWAIALHAVFNGLLTLMHSLESRDLTGYVSLAFLFFVIAKWKWALRLVRLALLASPHRTAR